MKMSLYESVKTSTVYNVEIKPNEVTDKLNLKGTYLLSVSFDDIKLLDERTQSPVTTWPLEYLRKYGRDKNEFSIEAGRRCDLGPGYFCFKTKDYNSIFEEVETNIKSQVAKSRKERKSSVSNYSNGAAVTKVSSPKSPSSSRVLPANSIYYSPLDAKLTNESFSSVYTLPVNSKSPKKPQNKEDNTKQKGEKNKTKGKGKLGAKKTSRTSSIPLPHPVEEVTYAEAKDFGYPIDDPGAEYNHINLGQSDVAEGEYYAISYRNETEEDECEYSTTRYGLPTSDNDVYDRVQW